MDIVTVNANLDNRVYIHPYQDRLCWIVDPSSASATLQALDCQQLQPTHILVTHHHADHIGGIPALKKKFGCRVVSLDPNRIADTDMRVSEGDLLALGRWSITVLAVPGHTADSVCYYCTHPDRPPVLYTGDTLFACGCGRLFECPAETLYHSLERLAALPDETRIYPGHDYTQDNLRFALTLEPNNSQLHQLRHAVRVQNEFVPTTLKQEKQCNPFLRCDQVAVQQAVGMDDPVRVFAELRKRKDTF